MIFWHTRHICRNLPFVNIPLFVTSFEVLPDRWWILAQFPISSNLPVLCKSPTHMPVLLSHCLNPAKFAGFAKYVLFVKPTIIDMPLLSSCFNFCQTLNKFLQNLSFSWNRHLSRCPFLPSYLNIWPNPWWMFSTLAIFFQNVPFSPKFAIFLL